MSIRWWGTPAVEPKALQDISDNISFSMWLALPSDPLYWTEAEGEFLIRLDKPTYAKLTVGQLSDEITETDERMQYVRHETVEDAIEVIVRITL